MFSALLFDSKNLGFLPISRQGGLAHISGHHLVFVCIVLPLDCRMNQRVYYKNSNQIAVCFHLEEKNQFGTESTVDSNRTNSTRQSKALSDSCLDKSLTTQEETAGAQILVSAVLCYELLHTRGAGNGRWLL